MVTTKELGRILTPVSVICYLITVNWNNGWGSRIRTQTNRVRVCRANIFRYLSIVDRVLREFFIFCNAEISSIYLQ
jgi:hypothetical protein